MKKSFRTGILKTHENNNMSLSCHGEMKIECGIVKSVSFKGMPRPSGDEWTGEYQRKVGSILTDNDINRILSYHNRADVISRFEDQFTTDELLWVVSKTPGWSENPPCNADLKNPYWIKDKVPQLTKEYIRVLLKEKKIHQLDYYNSLGRKEMGSEDFQGAYIISFAGKQFGYYGRRNHEAVRIRVIQHFIYGKLMLNEPFSGNIHYPKTRSRFG